MERAVRPKGQQLVGQLSICDGAEMREGVRFPTLPCVTIYSFKNSNWTRCYPNSRITMFLTQTLDVAGQVSSPKTTPD